MSADVAPIDRPQLAVTPATIQELVKRPLLALPVELRAEALMVWATHKHLKGMESPLSLTAALSVWVERFGLAVGDAKGILAAMLAPGEMAKAGFTSDFMTGLAARVDAVLKQRTREGDDERRRQYDEAANAGNLPPEVVQHVLRQNPFLAQFLTPSEGVGQ